MAKQPGRTWMRGIALGMALTAAGASGSEPEDEIRGLDAREAEAMRAADEAALAALWSPALVVNAPDNRVKSRDEVLQAVRDGRIRYASFQRTVERVVLDGDHAVTMGGERVVPTGERPDAGQTLSRRYSHLWRRSQGVWALVARHANVIPAPAE